jgi:hypothetical protein
LPDCCACATSPASIALEPDFSKGFIELHKKQGSIHFHTCLIQLHMRLIFVKWQVTSWKSVVQYPAKAVPFISSSPYQLGSWKRRNITFTSIH